MVPIATTDDPRRPYNVTLPESKRPLIDLIRAEYKRGGLSEFVDLCLDGYRIARAQKGRKLTELELDIATTEARQKATDARIQTAQAQRDLDDMRLTVLQDRLDKAQEELEKARALHLNVDQIVDLAWGTPPGPARTELLRKLADLHGHERTAVTSAAAARYKKEQEARAPQANLRAIPRGGAK